MSASLVGSEMCIRDSPRASGASTPRRHDRLRELRAASPGSRGVRRALVDVVAVLASFVFRPR
eukprot:284805-Alexandrium_andersonii.AAC.1